MRERYNNQEEIKKVIKSISNLKEYHTEYEHIPNRLIYLCKLDCGINIGGRGCVFDNKKPLAIECMRNSKCPCDVEEVKKNLITLQDIIDGTMTTSEW